MCVLHITSVLCSYSSSRGFLAIFDTEIDILLLLKLRLFSGLKFNITNDEIVTLLINALRPALSHICYYEVGVIGKHPSVKTSHGTWHTMQTEGVRDEHVPSNLGYLQIHHGGHYIEAFKAVVEICRNVSLILTFLHECHCCCSWHGYIGHVHALKIDVMCQ